MKGQKFNIEKYPKTFAYVLENDTFNRRCNICGSVVLKETVKMEDDYPYQCMSCDENLFGIETHAQYLLDAIEILGGEIQFQQNESTELTPGILKSENGKAIVLPIRARR